MLTATTPPQVLSQPTGLMFLVDQNITVGKCPNDGAIFLGNGLSLPSAPKTLLLKKLRLIATASFAASSSVLIFRQGNSKPLEAETLTKLWKTHDGPFEIPLVLFSSYTKYAFFGKRLSIGYFKIWILLLMMPLCWNIPKWFRCHFSWSPPLFWEHSWNANWK